MAQYSLVHLILIVTPRNGHIIYYLYSIAKETEDQRNPKKHQCDRNPQLRLLMNMLYCLHSIPNPRGWSYLLKTVRGLGR